eukprot:CAMPEP_0180024138 /NCGR_PEP_ID=MMETSP0984-20121128/23925_1 /TAXON_ID=483367 /ORGANISM="non described non described, Strain CCMP 2436" /LENGTH=110 /DNA_ID=CAMNT_0021948609 /DNA_START=36 /DNA_END=369 /DNA_ORIENTATION=+
MGGLMHVAPAPSYWCGFMLVGADPALAGCAACFLPDVQMPWTAPARCPPTRPMGIISTHESLRAPSLRGNVHLQPKAAQKVPHAVFDALALASFHARALGEEYAGALREG